MRQAVHAARTGDIKMYIKF